MRISAVGSVRRIRALRLLGWTNNQLAEWAGLHPATIRRIAGGRTSTVQAATAARIAAVHRRMWDRLPKPRTEEEHRAVADAKAWALAQGWAPSMAWDDIDDPSESPKGIPTRRQPATELADIIGCLKAGESPELLALRLGVRRSSIARRLRRAGQHRWARVVGDGC